MDLNSLDDLYRDAILDHRRTPRNREVIDNPGSAAHAINPFCGDEVNLQLIFTKDRLDQVGAQAIGCSINQATTSMLSEAIVGKSTLEIRRLAKSFESMMRGADPDDEALKTMEDLPQLNGVREYPVRIKCALLSWSALEDALPNAVI